MNHTWFRLSALALAILVGNGCLPRTTIHKDPGPRDRGVRFYRPKPYLMIQPKVVTTQGQPPGEFVELSLVTLPDYSEEYSIHVRSGLGTNDTEITLDDGWNLTALNVNVDSKFDENLAAVNGLIGSVAKAAGGPSTVTSRDARMVVEATNVPMGLYEAVIANNGHRKFLVGFRYVGFLPFTPCPVDAGGVPDEFCCLPQQHEIYGLVFEKNVMTFKRLGDIRDLDETDGLNTFMRLNESNDAGK